MNFSRILHVRPADGSQKPTAEDLALSFFNVYEDLMHNDDDIQCFVIKITDKSFRSSDGPMWRDLRAGERLPAGTNRIRVELVDVEPSKNLKTLMHVFCFEDGKLRSMPVPAHKNADGTHRTSIDNQSSETAVQMLQFGTGDYALVSNGRLNLSRILGFFVTTSLIGFGSLFMWTRLQSREKEVKSLQSSLSNAKALNKKLVSFVQAHVPVKKTEEGDIEEIGLTWRKGINKTAIEPLIDEMLLNEDVNIDFIPDVIEKAIYQNVFTLMLSIMDEVMDTMAIEVMGHRLKMELRYLDEKPPAKNVNKSTKRSNSVSEAK